MVADVPGMQALAVLRGDPAFLDLRRWRPNHSIGKEREMVDGHRAARQPGTRGQCDRNTEQGTMILVSHLSCDLVWFHPSWPTSPGSRAPARVDTGVSEA